jgi:hypothetical protein
VWDGQEVEGSCGRVGNYLEFNGGQYVISEIKTSFSWELGEAANDIFKN